MYDCDELCPECRGKVEWDFDCHTYPQERDGRVTWMACMPCDSAVRYVCMAHNEKRCDRGCYEYGYHDGCGWSWTKGLNQSNPGSADNELKNPHWDEYKKRI